MMRHLFLRIKHARWHMRLVHWEYWPFAAVYFPVYPAWLWYALKSRALFFFGPSNPGIENSGFIMESKHDIAKNYPNLPMPPTMLVEQSTTYVAVGLWMQQHQLDYPLVAKPDIGMQGIGVYKIDNAQQLQELLSQIQIQYILQPFIQYSQEIGVFFVRTAAQPFGFITGVVEKKFVEVTGDGVSTLRQLLEKSHRFKLQIPMLEKGYAHQLDEKILPAGFREVLVPFGNHARGALFLDATRQMADVITPVILSALQSAVNFNFGRLDIRYHTLEDLVENKNWCIIEMNGAGSEPTHMYDPGNSLFVAWKEIIRHWRWLYQVSKEQRLLGHTDMPITTGWKMYRSFKNYKQQLLPHKWLQVTSRAL